MPKIILKLYFALTVLLLCYSNFIFAISAPKLSAVNALLFDKKQVIKSLNDTVILQDNIRHQTFEKLDQSRNFSVFTSKTTTLSINRSYKILLLPKSGLKFVVNDGEIEITIVGRAIFIPPSQKQIAIVKLLLGEYFVTNSDAIFTYVNNVNNGEDYIASLSGKLSIDHKFQKSIMISPPYLFQPKQNFIKRLDSINLENILNLLFKSNLVETFKIKQTDIMPNELYAHAFVKYHKSNLESERVVLSESLWRIGLKKKALELLEKTSYHPNILYFRRAQMAISEGKWAYAKAALSKIEKIYVENSGIDCEINFYNAVVFYKLKEYANSERYFEEVKNGTCENGLKEQSSQFLHILNYKRGFENKFSFAVQDESNPFLISQKDSALDRDQFTSSIYRYSLKLWDKGYLIQSNVKKYYQFDSLYWDFRNDPIAKSSLSAGFSMGKIRSSVKEPDPFQITETYQRFSLITVGRSDKFISILKHYSFPRFSINGAIELDPQKRIQTNFSNVNLTQTIKFLTLSDGNAYLGIDGEFSEMAALITSDASGHQLRAKLRSHISSQLFNGLLKTYIQTSKSRYFWRKTIDENIDGLGIAYSIMISKYANFSIKYDHSNYSYNGVLKNFKSQSAGIFVEMSL